MMKELPKLLIILNIELINKNSNGENVLLSYNINHMFLFSF